MNQRKKRIIILKKKKRKKQKIKIMKIKKKWVGEKKQ